MMALMEMESGSEFRRACCRTHALILLNVQGVGNHFLRRAAFWPAPLQGDPADAGSDKPGCRRHLGDVSQRVAHDLLAVTTVEERAQETCGDCVRGILYIGDGPVELQTAPSGSIVCTYKSTAVMREEACTMAPYLSK